MTDTAHGVAAILKCDQFPQTVFCKHFFKIKVMFICS